MFKKGFIDTIHPIAILMGIVAAVWIYYVAGTMGSGVVMKFITGVIVGFVCFVIANFIFTKD